MFGFERRLCQVEYGQAELITEYLLCFLIDHIIMTVKLLLHMGQTEIQDADVVRGCYVPVRSDNRRYGDGGRMVRKEVFWDMSVLLSRSVDREQK